MPGLSELDSLLEQVHRQMASGVEGPPPPEKKHGPLFEAKELRPSATLDTLLDQAAYQIQRPLESPRASAQKIVDDEYARTDPLDLYPSKLGDPEEVELIPESRYGPAQTATMQIREVMPGPPSPQAQDAAMQAARERAGRAGYLSDNPPTAIDRALDVIDRTRFYAESTAGNLAEGVAIGVKTVEDALIGDMVGKQDLKDYSLFKLGEALRLSAEERLPPDPGIRRTFLNESLPAAAASYGPALLAGLAGGPVGIAAFGAGTGAGAGYEDAAQFTTDEKTRMAAAGWNALLGLTEAAPIGNMLKRFNKASKGLLETAWNQAAKNVATGTIEEMAQETVSQMGSNAVARMYDQDRDVFEGVVDAGGSSGVVSAIANTVLQIIGQRRAKLAALADKPGAPSRTEWAEATGEPRHRAPQPEERIQQAQQAKEELAAQPQVSRETGEFEPVGEPLGPGEVELGKGPPVGISPESAAAQGLTDPEIVGDAPRDEPIPPQPDPMAAPQVPRRMPVKLDRPPGEVATTSAPEVIKALTDAAAAVGQTVPVKTGRMHSARHAGEYYPKAEVIRTAQANDIPTATHEVGHAIEKSLGPKGLTGLPQGVWKELVSLGQIIYAKEPHNGWASEGVAETVRRYVTDRASLKRLAPKADAWFENDVLGKTPALKDAVARAVEQARIWADQGAYNRAKESMVDVGSPKERIREAATGARKFASFQEWIDSNEPLRAFSEAASKRLGRPIDPESDPAELAGYFTKGLADRRVGYMVERGMVDPAGNVVGDPLSDVAALLEKSDEAATDFALYLWAKRTMAETFGKRGKQRATGLDPDDAQQIISEIETPQIQLAAQKYYDWNDGVLNYIAQASPTMKAAVDAIRADSPGFYAPLQRIFQDFEKRYVSSGAGGDVAGGTITGRFKGSGRQIKNILTQTIQNAKTNIEAAHRRAVMDAVVQLSNVEGMGHLIQKVKRNNQVVATRSVADLVDALARESGMSAAEIKDFIESSGGDTQALVSIFAPEKKAPSGSYILPYFDPSTKKLDFYELAPDLYEATVGADPYALPTAARMLLSPIRVGGTIARAGYTTLRPVFSLARNPARDFPEFMVQSRAEGSAVRLFGHYLQSIGEMLKRPVAGRSETFELYERLGVGASHMIGSDISKARRAQRKLFQKKIIKVLDPRNWVSAFADAINWPEGLPRSAEMRAVLRDIGSPVGTYAPGGSHLSLPEAMAARKAASRVTTDFERAGRFARAVNPYVPFFNAAIQGTRTQIESIKRNPSRYILRSMLGITIPTLLTWWWNKDEEWYQELDDRERFEYAHIPVGENVVRVPRGHGGLNAIFGAMPEALLNSWYYSDPKGATEWMQHAFGALLPDPTNVPVAKEVIQQLANRDYFFDRPIVPQGLDRRPVNEQYNEYTTRVSRFVGKQLGVSPMRIDHALRSIFGPNALDAAQLLGTDDKVPNREKELSDLPIIGWAFMRGGELGPRPRSVQDVYDIAAEYQRRGASEEKPETPMERNKRLMLDDATRAISRLTWVRAHTAGANDRQAITREMLDIAKQAIEAEKAPIVGPMLFQERANAADRRKKMIQATTPSQ